MKPAYSQLDLDERRKVERWHHAGVSIDVIAEKLGRHRSTIFREIARNKMKDPEMPELNGYFCVAANGKERRSRYRKLIRNPGLRASIIERIKHSWSPEQIAGRLAYEGSRVRVCHETIYRFAYSSDGQEIKLRRYLPESRARRRPRHVRRRHGRRFGVELNILHRPDIVRDRKQLGHWECDLIQFRKKFGKANVRSLVERVSRFPVFLRNTDRQSRSIMEGLINALGPLPHAARRSITFDRGTEFTDWPYLQAGLGVQTWFCDPQSPWPKGMVENTNRRVRRWLSRDTDPLSIEDRHLHQVCAHLNTTPRKCLGFRTPSEVFRQKLVAGRQRRRAGRRDGMRQGEEVDALSGRSCVPVPAGCT